MISAERADQIDPSEYTTKFEYRTSTFDESRWRPHPHDCSLVTFRGHSVLRTLIRCHFSPPGSTGSRYVYSGSFEGSVYIWNMDATLKAKINVLDSTRNTRPTNRSCDTREYDVWEQNTGTWNTCVRDASWHPYAPVIAGKNSHEPVYPMYICSYSNPCIATSWNGWTTAQGTCTVHTWNDGLECGDEGDPSSQRRVGPKLEYDEGLCRPSGNRTRSRRHNY